MISEWFKTLNKSWVNGYFSNMMHAWCILHVCVILEQKNTKGSSPWEYNSWGPAELHSHNLSVHRERCEKKRGEWVGPSVHPGGFTLDVKACLEEEGPASWTGEGRRGTHLGYAQCLATGGEGFVGGSCGRANPQTPHLWAGLRVLHPIIAWCLI